MEWDFWNFEIPKWLWVLAAVFLAIFVLMLCSYLARGPRWFGGRADRRVLEAAALEILEHRRANGEISDAQFEKLKRNANAIR